MDFQTTAIYENRIRDKKELLSLIPMSEIGDESIKFSSHKDNILCCGYNRIVFGDHGPYIEFSENHINLDNWKIERSGYGYYDKFYPKDESCILMYRQRKTVRNLKNPPKSSRSFNGNREEGYADYIVGKYYISPYSKNLKIFKNDILLNHQKCNLVSLLFGDENV
jgi:hypothetical protein